MANLRISLFLLAFVLVFTAVNGIIVSRRCEQILSLCLSGDVAGAVSLYESNEKYFSLFVRDSDTDSAAAAAEGLKSGTPNSAAAFLLAIREIQAGESLAFFNLF